jgi:hypothetical protein
MAKIQNQVAICRETVSYKDKKTGGDKYFWLFSFEETPEIEFSVYPSSRGGSHRLRPCSLCPRNARGVEQRGEQVFSTLYP